MEHRGGGLSPSQRNPLPSAQHLAGGGGPLWLRLPLGSTQDTALLRRGSFPPRPSSARHGELRTLFHTLGPHIWDGNKRLNVLEMEI